MSTTFVGTTSRPIKRRRTSADMKVIRAGLWEIAAEGRPMTVRQIFYQAVACGLVDKTEREYKKTVVRLLTEMRLADDSFGRAIPFDWIADNTRWMRKPRSWSSVDDVLRETAQFYRRRLWDEQDAYVEIWLEKEALAGVVYPVTEEWDVPLMVTRGYPSISYLHMAAEAITEAGKPAYIYYFGDHDPSGVDISRNVEDRLREFTWANIVFRRVAVTTDQVIEWSLPTRPTKKSDTRSKRFAGESVELDAIPPDELRQLVRGCIEQHIDRHRLDVTLAAEKSEREVLMQIAG